LKKIPIKARQPDHLLSLVEGRWRERVELARLLRCSPNGVHRHLHELADKGGVTVISAGNAFATLRPGWTKKDLWRLIEQLRNPKPNPSHTPLNTTRLGKP
jgi:hypothetical protein